jgi:hypothetical protein
VFRFLKRRRKVRLPDLRHELKPGERVRFVEGSALSGRIRDQRDDKKIALAKKQLEVLEDIVEKVGNIQPAFV